MRDELSSVRHNVRGQLCRINYESTNIHQANAKERDPRHPIAGLNYRAFECTDIFWMNYIDMNVSHWIKHHTIFWIFIWVISEQCEVGDKNELCTMGSLLIQLSKAQLNMPIILKWILKWT